MISEGVLRVTFFSNLHSLVVFIVLGIAADDIFVFIDAWRQSKVIAPAIFQDDIKKRMAYTFRRASRAMAVTSSTTSVAFFANAFSPLMPIKAFGIFAGIIIPMNFFLVVLVFPSAVIISENLGAKMKGWYDRKFNADRVVAIHPEIGEEAYSFLELFFRNTWNNGVRKFRWLIVVITIGWIAYAASQAAQIGPLTE